MRNKHYPVRQFRISDENYQTMLKLKEESWNILFNKLLKPYGYHTIQSNRGKIKANRGTYKKHTAQTKEVKTKYDS